ncbi:hypothetical protein NQ315_000528 [Exocentrus adspersus]|uniref:Nucleolar protein 11 n=1 Tax=Exocentrus adspersus TaxID=1586481 RepID=A0AAV8VDF5_9CUCU|nr:hypothetical protein NQ315_000528 [Exocentrus adspersus]
MYNLMNYFGKMKLSRDDYQTDYSLKGYIFHSFENTVHLLTLWSDRRIFSQALEDSEDSLISSDLFGVIESVSAKYAVCMLALDANYIAMFGANCNEEGAVLLIYNTQFKVTQSKQSFKLFTNGARLWCYENNLLLPVGQNLAVVPFYLETEQLAALIGSHKIVNDEVDADIAIVQEFEVGSWDKKMKLRDVSIPGSLKFKIEEAVKKGLPESIITEELLSSIVNDQDLESLMLYLNTFLDIPEKLIAKILKFLINANKKIFPNQSRSMSKLFPSDLQPLSRTELIDKILCKPFSDILLIPHLRSELALADVITLLRYICFLCSEEGHLLPGLNVVKSQAALIEWCLAVVDANYQKLLFSKDDCVTDVVNEIDNMVAEHLVPVEDFKFLLTILNYYKAKRMNSNSVCINNVKYSIEQVCFY